MKLHSDAHVIRKYHFAKHGRITLQNLPVAEILPPFKFAKFTTASRLFSAILACRPNSHTTSSEKVVKSHTERVSGLLISHSMSGITKE